MSDTEIRCVEVKDYPAILNVFSRINQQIIRPKQEKILDEYEKANNISKSTVNEHPGNGEISDNK